MRRSPLLLPALLWAACSPPDAGDAGDPQGDAGTYLPVDCRAAPARSATWDAGLRSDGGQQIQFPAPTGRFGIGRGVRRSVYEPNRDELDTPNPNDKRTISVEVWFPTDACASGAPPPTLDEAESSAMQLPLADPWWRTAQNHGTEGAMFVQDGERHPVLLFSPGYNGSPRMYTALVEALVSNGYVVALISHTYWAPATLFGTAVVPGFHTTAGLTFEMADQEAEVWMHDGLAALDGLAEWDAADPAQELTGRLDLSRVGALGHSFGGAMALNVMGADARVKAGANLDGNQFGPSRDGGGPVLSRPSLIFYSERPDDPSMENVFSAATGPAWALRLAGSGHITFSDPSTVNPQLGYPLPPAFFGTIEPRRAQAVINTWVLGFFDRALKGETVPLLDGPSGDHPEVQVRRRN